MKQVVIRRGTVEVVDVPAPGVEPGTILVRARSSCISVGTELGGIRTSGMPLWKKALKDPAKVRAALKMMAGHGLARTRAQVREKVGAAHPVGYSAAGTLVDAGEGVDDLRPGDRVAVAGTQCAHHAEVLRIPRNLAVPIPEGVDFACASTVALGAIALQGVRRASPTLGECFVVIGLGVLGQLTSQLLKANGMRVIVADLDRQRIDTALSLGADLGVEGSTSIAIEQVARLTGGLGADGVIITAASSSDEVVSTAFGMCRKKGRVVLVGDVGLNLKRSDMFSKELDFFISTSYGPGRYERKFEEEGLDYPPAFVRWTENRNMAEYLRLVSEGRVRLDELVSATYPVEQAETAYRELRREDAKPLMVLLSYAVPEAGDGSEERILSRTSPAATEGGRVRIAVIGAGGFAKSVHLPNLKDLSGSFHVAAIASRTGLNASETADRYDARYSTTEVKRVLADPEIDAVLIATRHDQHASQALEALRAGKHVLLEKPMALSREDLDSLAAFFAEEDDQQRRPLLLTGFNRRFSPHARKAGEWLSARSTPVILNYRMNAGRIPPDHWVHGPEGGGRNLGEACHIYDLFTFLTGSAVADVDARTARPDTDYYSALDNFVATITFEDGSLASLTYTSLGSTAYPKERMEAFCEGMVIHLDDFRETTCSGAKKGRVRTRRQDKGLKHELVAFGDAIREGGPWPIPLWQQVQATDIALHVEELLGR